MVLLTIAFLFSVGVLPESLSGSETDVSTSNENLSHEERYVIRHTARQEPQGQENLPPLSSSRSSPNSNRSSITLSGKLEGVPGSSALGSGAPGGGAPGNGGGPSTNPGSNRSSVNRPDNGGSNRSSLDVSSSSYNTLIIHGTLDEPWSGRYFFFPFLFLLLVTHISYLDSLVFFGSVKVKHFLLYS